MSALDCRELSPMLQPYVDGEIDSSERADIETHLGHCASCQGVVAQARAFKLKLREAASVRAPEHLRSRIQGTLRSERRWATLRAMVRPEIVAAVAACAGVAAWFSSRYLLSPILEDAVAHHAHNLPVEVQGDEQHVQSWFQDKVDFNVHLPHLSRVSIAGARLSHVRDHNAAYVVYQGPKAHRVSLFVFDDPQANIELLGLSGGRRARIADREVVLANQRGYNVAMWHDDEIVYSLVSDLDERDILELLQGRNAGPAQVGGVEHDAPVPTPDVQPAALHVP